MELIRMPDAKKVLIAGHENPDGDSLSCSVAMYNHYKKKGTDVRVWIYGEVQEHLTWIVDRTMTEDQPTEFAPDLLIILDTAVNSKRTGMDIEALRRAGTKVIGIDHHASYRLRKPIYISHKNIPRLNLTIENTRFVEVIQPYKASTASILVDYFGVSDPILYVGIRTDSGNFYRDTLQCMGQVARLAITQTQIEEYHQRMNRGPKDPKILEHIKKNGLVNIVNGEDKFHLMAIEEDSKDIAKNLLYILKMFYRNIGVVWESGVSFRSENIDVSFIAHDLGGGGHSHAAGSAKVSVKDMPLIKQVIEKQLYHCPCH